MAENHITANSSRLSLALVDLPLTPFGMKNPASISKKKILRSNEKQNKLSRRQLKFPQETLHNLSPLGAKYDKENFNFPQNVVNVNTRRKLKNKKCKEKESKYVKGKYSDENSFENRVEIDSNSLPTYMGSCQKNERRDSVFTDIDEGSFIEFIEKSAESLSPLDKKCIPQFYYTCTDDNETRYSTSSKTPLASVGFHKFVDTLKSKNLFNKIAEDSSVIKEKKSIHKTPFELDESVIAGSRDVLDLKKQRNKPNTIMNSTEYFHSHFVIRETPDISTLSINHLPSNSGSKHNVDCNSNKPQNKNHDIECIVLSESDDESREKDKLVTRNFQQYINHQWIPNENELVMEPSLITEDVSILSSLPKTLEKQENFYHNPSNECLGPLVDKNKETDLCKENKIESRFEEVICIPGINERVVGWVLNSPFKDGSFGTSLIDNKVQTSRYLQNDRKLLDLHNGSQQSLVLRLSDEHTCSKGSGETVFTLGRIAELPKNKGIVEAVKTPVVIYDSDSSDCEETCQDLKERMTVNRKLVLSTSSSDGNINNSGCSHLPTIDGIDNQILPRNHPKVKKKNNFQVLSSPVIICANDSDEETLNNSECLGRYKFKQFYSSDDSSNSRDEKVSRRRASSGKLSKRKSTLNSNMNLVLSSDDSDDDSIKTNSNRMMESRRRKATQPKFINSYCSSIRKCSHDGSKSLSDNDYPNTAEPNYISSSASTPILTSKSETSLSKSRSDNEINLTTSPPFHIVKNSHSKSLNEINLKRFNSFPNSEQETNTVQKGETVFKSKFRNNVNVVNNEQTIDSDSSSETSPDRYIKKPITKSQLMKPLSCDSFSDSGSERPLQRIRKELDKLYKDAWKENEKNVLSTLKIEKVNNPPQSTGKTSSHLTHSSTQNKYKTPNLKKKKDIPQLYLSPSDSSDDDKFENYINSLKQKGQKPVHRQVADENFVVSDCEDTEFYLPSPLSSPLKGSKKNINYPHTKGSSITRNETTPNCNYKWRNMPRLILDSSSDSEEERFPLLKPQKVLNFKTPKQSRAFINKEQSLKTHISSITKSSSKYLSFLASLTLDIPLNKVHPHAIPFIKNFKKEKESLTSKLYGYFNLHIFENKLPPSMNIRWNSRMTKTAGFCYYQIDRSKASGRGARIELSTKVIDTPERLRDTLIHELCHAASWILSGYKDGHGPLWKSWTNKTMSVFPELPFISRCHSYEINCKYTYRCTKCGYSIGRHSKSLKTEEKVCGYCYGKFELLVNYSSKGTSTKYNALSDPSKETTKTPRTPSAFALYVKENYGSIKRKETNLKHGDIMRALSDEFAKLKTKI